MKILKEEERLDDLQRDGLKIIQNRRLFCFGMDAVLLSAFANEGLKESSRVLDLCSGNGIIPILMDSRGGRRHSFTAVEINPLCVDMALRSIEYNGQQDRILIHEADIKTAKDLILPASFDAVTVNPPYMISGHGKAGENTDRMIARHEILCTLDDVVSVSARALKMSGHFFMVHRPFRLGDIFRSLNKAKLEIKRLRMVYPFAGKEANLVLIEAVKGGRPGMVVEKALTIYEKPGVYTKEVRELYDA